MAADGPGSMAPSRRSRQSGRVTSRVPRRSFEPKPKARRTTRGRSESTVSTLSGVTDINADIYRSHLMMWLCVRASPDLGSDLHWTRALSRDPDFRPAPDNAVAV